MELESLRVNDRASVRFAVPSALPQASLREGLVNGARVLVLDPNEQATREYARAFVERSWDIVHCRTFLEALPVLEGPAFDLVLVEMTLPDILGTEAWAFIQKLQPNAAGIITTGSVSLYKAIDALGAGADAYLLKPLESSQLCQLVAHLLERQRIQNQTKRIQKQLSGLSGLVFALFQTKTLEQIVNTTYAYLRGVLHFDVALIYLWHYETGEWVCHPPPQAVHYEKELTVEQGDLIHELIGQAAIDLKPIALAADLVTYPSQRKLLEVNNLTACVVVPLHNQKHMQGAIVIVNKDGSEWKLESLDLNVLAALAGTINIALDRAELCQIQAAVGA